MASGRAALRPRSRSMRTKAARMGLIASELCDSDKVRCIQLRRYYSRARVGGSFGRRRRAHQLLRFLVERLRLARGPAQRLLQHAPIDVETGRDALSLLERQPIEVLAPHELFNGKRALGIEPERFERLAAECQRRFVGFPQLEAHALGNELQSMTTIIGAHVKLRSGEFGPHEIDDSGRGGTVVDADGDNARLACPGSAQHVEACAVTIVDLETEASGLPDHFWIAVDGGNVDALCQQALRDELAKPSPANDEHRTARIGEILGVALRRPREAT